MASALPTLSEAELDDMENRFAGGPRKAWETRDNAKYHDYYKLLSGEQIKGLQELYKWDYTLFNYSSDPFHDKW